MKKEKCLKKCNLIWAVSKVGVGDGCSEWNKTYHKAFKEIFKQHCAAVEYSLSMSLAT